MSDPQYDGSALLTSTDGNFFHLAIFNANIMYHHHSYDGDAAIIKLSRHKERGGAEADDQNLIGNSLVICKSPDCVV